MALTVTTGDLGTFMNVTLDEGRAQLMLDLAESLAASVVDPLPDAAKVVVLTAAARAYPNPSGTVSEAAAGASATWGTGGLYLSRSERATLRRMAGTGAGAFTVNTAPCAGKHYVDSLRPATVDDMERFVLDQDVL